MKKINFPNFNPSDYFVDKVKTIYTIRCISDYQILAKPFDSLEELYSSDAYKEFNDDNHEICETAMFEIEPEMLSYSYPLKKINI